jgi:hypothetical protein
MNTTRSYNRMRLSTYRKLSKVNIYRIWNRLSYRQMYGSD